VSGYRPLKAQTATLDSRKKTSEQATIVPATGKTPCQRRVAIPASAGIEIATKPTAVMRQSSFGSAMSLSAMPSKGTMTASAGIRR
jgi:hypothetical protein